MIDVVGVKRAFFLAALIFTVCLNEVERAKAADTGEEMYNVNCGICHTIGSGRLVGPDLAGVQERRSQEWLLSFVKSSQSLIASGDAEAIAVFDEYGRIPMPDPPISVSQIKEVLDYIRTKSANTEVAAPDLAEVSGLVGAVQQAANLSVEPLGAGTYNPRLGVGPRREVTAPAPLGVGVPASTETVSEDDIGVGQDLFQGTLRFTNNGPACNLVTTVYDLIMAQYGVGRGLAGAYPTDYTDKDAAYTPAWQEIFTGIDSKTVPQFAREWAGTAEITEGKCMIIIGAGINHWYHANLMYRAGAMALMLSGE